MTVDDRHDLFLKYVYGWQNNWKTFSQNILTISKKRLSFRSVALKYFQSDERLEPKWSANGHTYVSMTFWVSIAHMTLACRLKAKAVATCMLTYSQAATTLLELCYF